jgi:glyoxylase-like metal-dependent hydrolase (beta-lactamase superfamily II)
LIVTAWICATCANQHADSSEPPAVCAICADERQWVPPSGQHWTTLSDLAAAGHRSDIRTIEHDLIGIGVEPAVGIGQRALLVCTSHGNLLWDPPGFLDSEAIASVRAAGGLVAVAASHPHFYGVAVEWSHAFDSAPILLPEADQHWLMRPDPAVQTWSGHHQVLPGVTLVQCGGHFPGSAVLHWADGAEGRGVLLVGDTIVVTPGADRVSFSRSVPNHLPLPEASVRGILRALRPYQFDRLYGALWLRIIDDDARRVVTDSADRYLQWLRGEAITTDAVT